MERKDYSERFQEIKNDILKEIKNIIPLNGEHEFNDTVYVHYIEGEVATTEICKKVKVGSDSMVVFVVYSDTYDKESVIEDEQVFMYDSESFLNILDTIKKEVRERKLKEIRVIIKMNGYDVQFDGSFDVTFHSSSNERKGKLTRMWLREDGRLKIDSKTDGIVHSNFDEDLNDEEIDRILCYILKNTKQRRTIKVEVEIEFMYDPLHRDFLTMGIPYIDAVAEDMTIVPERDVESGVQIIRVSDKSRQKVWLEKLV